MSGTISVGRSSVLTAVALETVDPRFANLVDLHFFCGFTLVDIAMLRGVSDRTVQSDWRKARLLLHRFLSAT